MNPQYIFVQRAIDNDTRIPGVLLQPTSGQLIGTSKSVCVCFTTIALGIPDRQEFIFKNN